MAALEKSTLKKSKPGMTSKSRKTKPTNERKTTLEKQILGKVDMLTESSCSQMLLSTKTNEVNIDPGVATKTNSNADQTDDCADLSLLSKNEMISFMKESCCDSNDGVLDKNNLLKPTAPTLKISYPQLPIKEFTEEVLLPDPIKKETIKPFTECQLKALYKNEELVACKQFVAHFIDSELRGVNAKQHHLYELLICYLRAKNKLQENIMELDQLKVDYNSCQNELWCVDFATVTSKAHCQDGVYVYASHKYKVAKFQRSLLENLIAIQQKIKKCVNETHTLYSFSTTVLKMKIDHYIETVLSACRCSAKLSATSTVTLLKETLSSHVQHPLKELRICISVLFNFQRQFHKDKEFVTETRIWLTDMIAVLLRIADWQDHMYILNHVLRCPAGIGTWAHSYIQIPSLSNSPDVPFANRYLNHAVAVLSTLLCPIDKRNVFLEQMTPIFHESQDPAAENLWVFVDSDGEDEDNTQDMFALKENDLVALLNQIPIDDLFRCIICVRRRDNTDFFEDSEVTEHHVLRLFAFCTVLLGLFNEGLVTYNLPRYHQFAKRLCRLIRHTLCYVSDIWEILMNNNKICDTAMLKRLQTEYDAFFCRTALYLYQAKKLGAWQFLAVVPFHTTSMDTLWKIFFMLHMGVCQNDNLDEINNIDIKVTLSDASSRQLFSEKLSEMSAEESYYLFNTFANMIMARPSEDIDFIKFATLNMLQIGFCASDIPESSSKCVGILLSSITERYPHLISDIINTIKNCISHLSMPALEQVIIFLFSELPLHKWKPNDNDMSVLETWLIQHSVNTIESFLARKIISSLNWDISESGTLFLPLELHRDTALMIAQVVDKHITGGSVTILEGMKQAVGQPATPEQKLMKWAWQMVFRFRLHAIDIGVTKLPKIPEVVQLDVIQKGIREHQALAFYLALAITSVGHFPPLICSLGLTQLELLINAYRYDAALIALHNIVPLFVDSIDTLLMCASFKNILTNLLAADKTYMKIAKNFISAEFPGSILRQFGNMIASHTHNPKWQSLAIFWTRALISIPNWNKDIAILYLLNIVIKYSFFEPKLYEAVCDVFTELLKESGDRNHSGSSLFSWISFVGNVQGYSSSLLLGPGNVVSKEPWLGYLTTAVEHYQFEVKTGLWPELLCQLHSCTGKTNVDSCLKKAANIVKVPSFSSAGLCLYRWAQQALDTPLDHPLLPLLWQNFFTLYLARVPEEQSDIGRGSVGRKFFDGLVNTTFLKKLKKRLQESVDFYKSNLELPTSEKIENNSTPSTNKDFFQRCLALFNAYMLWLEEPLLQESALYLPSLPSQYEIRYLSSILHNSNSPWLELVNFKVIHNEYEKSKTEWRALCHRDILRKREPVKQISTIDSANPLDRIICRLNTYDKPQPVPVLRQPKLVIPSLKLTKWDLLASNLQEYIGKLQQFAEFFSLQVSEHGALECQYNDLIQQLYNNFQTKLTVKKTCKSACSGSATITLSFCEGRINENINNQMLSNRTNFATLLTRSLQPPTKSLCIISASIEETISELQTTFQDSLHMADTAKDEQLRTVGVEFFYYLFTVYNEEVKAYPPTKQLFDTCIEKLGRIFIYGVERETTRLCRTVLQQSHKSNLLSPHFSVINVSTSTFLQVYSDICGKIDQIPTVVYDLLSKFDVSYWLLHKKPCLTDCSIFIQKTIKSLTLLGHSPVKEKDTLHGIFRKHLISMFRHEFPKHYGEILILVLKNSGEQNLAVSVWTDILNSLAYPMEIKIDEQLKDQLRQHAAHQTMLQQKDLTETTKLLADYFTQERLQLGLYGLYPKYRAYIDPLCALLGMTGHAVIVATLNKYSNLLPDQLCDHLWLHLNEMFMPWLVPYLKNFKQQTTCGIQEINDDRVVSLPWIQADIMNAHKIFKMFSNCILFIGETLPASTKLLSYVWQYYVTHFAHPAIKEHIWVVVHKHLLCLVWERFWPSMADVQSMMKIINQCIPESHVFLGHVFLEVNWTSWLSQLEISNNLECSQLAHHYLLNLLIKLSNEPTVKQNDKCRLLLQRARDYSWHYLNIASLEQVLDWYVMSCDPRVSLSTESELKLVDYHVLRLIKVASCFEPKIISFDSFTLRKRQSFLRAYVKLLITCANRHKTLVSNKPQMFRVSLKNQLDHIAIMTNTACRDSDNDSKVLLSEILAVLNNAVLSPIALSCFEEWLSDRTSESHMLHAFLRTIATTVISADTSGALLECALNSYFHLEFAERERPTWRYVTELINLDLSTQHLLEQSVITNGRLLTLRVFIMKRVNMCEDCSFHILLQTIVDWLTHVKVTNLNESKLPLLWTEVIKLSLLVCHRGDEPKASIILRKFVHNHLLQIAECKSNGGGWGRGILGAIGLVKQNSISVRGRFLCKALAGFILAQLPETKSESQTVRCFAGASGTVGQPGGNSECAKILMKLDCGSDFKTCVENALRQIQDPQNSLHSAEEFLFGIADILYSDLYLMKE